MTDTTFMGIRIVLDCVGLVILVFAVYILVYCIKKYMLEKWVAKAVNAAEEIYKAPKHTKVNSAVKKEWVLKFLQDNGLTAGVSDEQVDVLIEAKVNSITLKQNEGEGSFIKKWRFCISKKATNLISFDCDKFYKKLPYF